MAPKGSYLTILLFLLLLSCASHKTQYSTLEQRSTKDSMYKVSRNESPDTKMSVKKFDICAKNQKYSNGLEVYEEISNGRFRYEFKPNQKERYSFEYLAQSEDDLNRGTQFVKSKLKIMTEELIGNLESPANSNRIDRGNIVLVPTTFVNIDDVHHTTSFGRYCSEQLANFLSVKGVKVIEIRKVDVILNVRMIEADNRTAIIRSTATGLFNRRNNPLVNYLISKINSLNLYDPEFGTSSNREFPNIGITTITASDTERK